MAAPPRRPPNQTQSTISNGYTPEEGRTLTSMAATATEEHIKIPIEPVSGVMRIFVHVGPKYGEPAEDKWVQVDTLLRGSLGAPEGLNSVTETISAATTTGTKEYVVIDLLHHFRSKLGAFSARNTKSDIEDLLFMCLQYPEEVGAFCDQLSVAQRKHFVEEFIRQTGEGHIADMLKDLLGVGVS